MSREAIGPVGGLSPRVRRSPLPADRSAEVRGSISARAEEPRGDGFGGVLSQVYLRACGGAIGTARVARQAVGLSPRVRRSPYVGGVLEEAGRSISARAEEPAGAPWRDRPARVYLRACGGANRVQPLKGEAGGLSPRVRRSRRLKARLGLGIRSISARAEEPTRNVREPHGLEVYLRACGGATVARPTSVSVVGLSPRVRRSREAFSRTATAWGSISARAEEPNPHASERRIDKVYLRACGGAPARRLALGQLLGLSPRVRRSLLTANVRAGTSRSISARAEEPLAANVLKRFTMSKSPP